MVKKKDKVVKEPEPEPEPAPEPEPEPEPEPAPEPEPEPEPVVETPKKSDGPFKRLLTGRGGRTWYVDADGNKLED
jgi:hypothetical protein